MSHQFKLETFGKNTYSSNKKMPNRAVFNSEKGQTKAGTACQQIQTGDTSYIMYNGKWPISPAQGRVIVMAPAEYHVLGGT